VRPGITGWAQVRYGYANDLQEEIEKMHYDMYYIKYHSFRLDFEIIVRTVAVIMLGSESPRMKMTKEDAVLAEPVAETASVPKEHVRLDEQSAA
jgi:hypothetical protein